MEHRDIYSWKYVQNLIALTLILGVGGWWMIDHFFSEVYFSLYPIVPVYFFCFGLLTLFLTRKWVLNKPAEKGVMIFAAIRMLKLIVSVLFLVLMGLLMRSHFKNLMVVFVAYYLIFLGFDSLFYAKNKPISSSPTE